jgi:3-mercaptopyruvate sulfurtransferase SseA
MRTAICALAALVTLTAFGATAGGQEEDTSSPALRIEWAEFKKLYDRQALVLIDVRNVPSFEAGHIPGARSIPLEEIDKHAAALKKLKPPIVLYCA